MRRLLPVVLALSLFAPAFIPTHAEAESTVAAVDCDCPPDCHCHKPGGSCPGGKCVPGCKCDGQKIAGIYVHPSVVQAIEENEVKLLYGDDDAASDHIVINGVEQFTGFRPTRDMYEGAETFTINVPDDYEMKEIDFSQISYSPVRGQVQGSCWAEGCGSTFELRWNSPGSSGLPPGLSKLVFAVQDVIDCSGMGSARSGGQSSLAYAINGLAYESDYPYTGRDGRCKKSVARSHPLIRAPFIRGANGGLPNEREINYYLNTYGPMEVCGCAGALGNGGWQEGRPRSCGTNHCYSHGGMRLGSNYGHAAVWFHGMKNSWGDGQRSNLNPGGRNWGADPNGWGWYNLASAPGGKTQGSVITELQGAMIDFPVTGPVEPIKFTLSFKGVVVVVTIAPEDQADFKQDALTKRIESAIAMVES